MFNEEEEEGAICRIVLWYLYSSCCKKPHRPSVEGIFKHVSWSILVYPEPYTTTPVLLSKCNIITKVPVCLIFRAQMFLQQHKQTNRFQLHLLFCFFTTEPFCYLTEPTNRPLVGQFVFPGEVQAPLLAGDERLGSGIGGPGLHPGHRQPPTLSSDPPPALLHLPRPGHALTAPQHHRHTADCHIVIWKTQIHQNAAQE